MSGKTHPKVQFGDLKSALEVSKPGIIEPFVSFIERAQGLFISSPRASDGQRAVRPFGDLNIS